MFTYETFRTFLNVAFLNLMAIVAQRGGTLPIRVGGNTQETATLVESLADGKALEKDKVDSSNPICLCLASLYSPR